MSTADEIRRALTDEQQGWLDEKNVSARHVVEMARIRDEHSQRYRSLVNWVAGQQRGRTRLQLLRRIVERRTGVTYDTLAGELDVSKRHVKGLVGDLRDKEIVVTDGNPAVVRFTGEDMRLLASDVAMLF